MAGHELAQKVTHQDMAETGGVWNGVLAIGPHYDRTCVDPNATRWCQTLNLNRSKTAEKKQTRVNKQGGHARLCITKGDRGTNAVAKQRSASTWEVQNILRRRNRSPIEIQQISLMRSATELPDVCMKVDQTQRIARSLLFLWGYK